MKKIFVMLSFSFLFGQKTDAQIPNAGFENWFIWFQGCDPDYWFKTEGGPICYWVTPDSSFYNSGSRSMKLRELGEAYSVKFPITNHPINLFGYYSYYTNTTDSIKIGVTLFYNSLPVDSGQWSYQSSNSVNSFSLFSVPISQTNTLADSAMVKIIGPKYGSTISNDSTLFWVDDLSFDSISGINSNEVFPMSFSIFPNPSQGEISITLYNSANSKYSIEIVDLLGTILLVYETSENAQFFTLRKNLVELSNGSYFVFLKSKNDFASKKLIIVK